MVPVAPTGWISKNKPFKVSVLGTWFSHFQHALDEARARNAPPPRLAALLRGSPGLVFLKGDL